MPHRDFNQPGHSLAVAENGMVATSHPMASLAALDVLKEGGNAVDAAICAIAMQCVVDPLMTGIGGDCFALYAPAGQTPVGLNGSGRAPAAATLDYFEDRKMARIDEESVHAVTIPGAVDAWFSLSKRYGRLGMDRVLAPAQKAAEEGFLVTPRVALDWETNAARVMKQDAARAAYMSSGRAPQIGDKISHPALARTLALIMREGPSAFYQGKNAREMVRTLNELGGLHTEEDFATYRSEFVEPISARYRDRMLLECPPNGQGLAALLIARLLDGFDLADPALSAVERIHLLAEATKLGYDARDRFIADPEVSDVDVEGLLSDATIDAVRARIDPFRASPGLRWEGPTHRDTVYVSVIDRDRNAMSMINSIFNAFGSGIYAPGAGVLFHNRGAGFRLERGHPNAIAPRKRPFHTIIPGMVFKDNRAEMSFGVMGGQYQATGQVHVLSQIVDRGLDPQAASDQPRSFYFAGKLELERTVGEETRAGLERLGHSTEWAPSPLGGCQIVQIDHDKGVLFGATDHRKDGIAIGY